MVGGLGVMGNDFHDRKDLTPNYERYGWKFLSKGGVGHEEDNCLCD